MIMKVTSTYLSLLKNRINLRNIPFSDRGSRLLVFQTDHKLGVRLAERWFKRAGQQAAYRQRPPLIEDWYFTDPAGHPLEYELETYPHCIHMHTSAGTFSIAFLDSETLIVRLPPGKYGMTFRANLDQAYKDRRGGVLRLTGDIRRNIAYTTNAQISENELQAIETDAHKIRLSLIAGEGCGLMLNITPRLGFNRYIPKPNQAIEDAAQRWDAWFAAAPPVPDQYRKQYYYAWWVMRAGLISPRYYTTREAMTPSKIHYVGVWQWDAFFHALAYRYVDQKLAQDQIRILLDHQREDGMIPDAIHDEGVITHLNFPIDADVTKPPLIAWSAWKLYEHNPDPEFLAEIYEPISRWNLWWFEKNDTDHNGLCEYQHPFSSGLDDSPLWDGGMPVESPDLNTYLFLQQDSLAKIANVLGLKADARMWERRAKAMANRISANMWDPDNGLFWAKRNGQPIHIRTPFSLFPLLTGRLSPEVAQALVNHLNNPNEFMPRYPVPSVAVSDPHYNPEQMWRGPTWVNVNYLLIEGLQKSGYVELADKLSLQTLDLINSREDIYEYYHPETGMNPPKAASIFGWSSAIFIDLAIRSRRQA
jgi:Mannosylglycerate hydrolase MGH1-like glycoside hydrolase domain